MICKTDELVNLIKANLIGLTTRHSQIHYSVVLYCNSSIRCFVRRLLGFENVDDVKKFYLERIEMLKEKFGVLLFLYSVVCTKVIFLKFVFISYFFNYEVDGSVLWKRLTRWHFSEDTYINRFSYFGKNCLIFSYKYFDIFFFFS